MIAVVRLWVLLSALLVGAGWLLSACHQLNRLGYGIFLALGAAAYFIFRRKSEGARAGGVARMCHKFRRRFGRPLPGLFMVLAALSLLAGVLYVPHNGDSNAYRIPRVFHWLGAGQWHWIHAMDARLNISGTGFEWLCAPLISFTRYDRCLFLINWVSFLLLPGLIFSVFIRLGVRRSVAWWWMWVLASGWCYVWQAQDTNNDSLTAIYALAAVDFALRARHSGRVADWWLAILATALMTGAKQTSLPLLLVCGIALWPGLPTLLANPLRTFMVAVIGLLVSGLPLMILNYRHAGNWLGTTNVPYGGTNTELASPFWGVIGNIFCLTVQNLKPPIFPFDAKWNALMHQFLQTPFGSHFSSFENFGFLDKSAGGASSGIGLGVCVTLVASVWQARQLRRASPALRPAARDGLVWLLWLAPWVALLVFMGKVGAYQNARYLAPYYVFLFPIFLAAAGHARVVRQLWWRRLAAGVLVVTALMVVTSRGCPLFPAQTVLGWWHEKHPQSQALAHVLASFSSDNDVLIQRHCFAAELPRDEKIVGYYTISDGAEPGLWQPLGIRRVERLQPGDPPAYPRSLNIHYVVVDEQPLLLTGQTIGGWLQQFDGQLVSQTSFNLRWGEPPVHLYLVRLNPPAAG